MSRAPVLLLILVLAVPLLGGAPPADAQAGPRDCVTIEAPDGNEPPCNPHLAQPIWSASHRGPYAQASSPLPGPAGPAEEVDVFHDFLFDAPIQIQFSTPYADGRRVAWGSTVGFDGSIFKFDPETNSFIDRFSPTLEDGEAPGPGSISGAYNLIDADDHLIVGREGAVEVYGDAIPGDRMSPVARLHQFALPTEALCRDTDKLVGITMAADGRIAFATELGVVGVVPRQHREPTNERAQRDNVVLANGASCVVQLMQRLVERRRVLVVALRSRSRRRERSRGVEDVDGELRVAPLGAASANETATGNSGSRSCDHMCL